MNRKKILGLLIAVAVVSIPLHAATIYVEDGGSCDPQGPGTPEQPFCSIQAGYDATNNGDELRVMPGTYAECVYLYDIPTRRGVSIVADDFVVNGDKSSTVIDGTGLNCLFPGTTNPASVVNLGGVGSKFEGFTVTGASYSGVYGIGPVVITNNVVTDNSSTVGGGGMYVYTGPCAYGDATAEISFNEITNNTTTSDGGGIFISSGQWATICDVDGDSSVIVEGNSITGNVAAGSGGGILAATFTVFGDLSAEVVITSNTIANNEASSSTLFGWGGGIFGYTYGYGAESIRVVDNTVAANETLDFGGGVSLWIDPSANDTTIDHQIVVERNTLTDNQAGSGGGGLDVLVRTADLRINQRADVHILDNDITDNRLTLDQPEETFGGGGVLVFNESQNSTSPEIGVLVEGNDIANNAAFGFGGGVSVFAQAVANPANPPGAATVHSDVELRNNAITRNDARTNAQGWNGFGGGVFMLLETEGDAISRVDMPLNTIADNTIDTTDAPGGIHAETFIGPDAVQNEGEAILTLNSSIVASNDGVGFGGPSPGLPGYISPGGSDNFTLIMSYTDLYGNESGDLDAWIPAGQPGNIFEDPLLTASTYEPETCSPTIDAGDPAFAFDSEALPSGGRVNMGWTGNTSDATVTFTDASGDGVVDGVDIVRLSVAFGSIFPSARYNADVDIDKNDQVDGDDLSQMASQFGQVLVCP